MEFRSDTIILEKDLTLLDRFVLDFTARMDVPYVIISGYVAILFGRSRNSEDVDLFLQRVDEKEFARLWARLLPVFECINAPVADAYTGYLLNNNAIRFSRRNEYIPNMEVKFPKNALDEWALTHRRKVLLNGQVLWISPIELQIAYKLFLGSEKDIEDARFLHRTFEGRLDAALLEESFKKLGVNGLRRYL